MLVAVSETNLIPFETFVFDRILNCIRIDVKFNVLYIDNVIVPYVH